MKIVKAKALWDFFPDANGAKDAGFLKAVKAVKAADAILPRENEMNRRLIC